jgi:hypothetical protein
MNPTTLKIEETHREESMKKLSLTLMIAILLAVGAVAATSAPSSAQVYAYPAPPANIYATPWVGANTPWVYYRGDWFLNGVLQYFYGPRYGWAPYYAYPTTYIVRPQTWYAPKWNAWYQGHPRYWNNFHHNYPYWRNHSYTRRYDQRFYNQHHHGQGGWHQGYHGHPYKGPDRGHGFRPDQHHRDRNHGEHRY